MPIQDLENHYTKWHKANEEQSDTLCGILAGNRDESGRFVVHDRRWICADCLELSNTSLYDRLDRGEEIGAGELNQWLGGRAIILPTLLRLVHNRAATTAQRFDDYRRELEGLNLASRVEELEKIVARLSNNAQ